jgi:signal peptide peptidase SppA
LKRTYSTLWAGNSESWGVYLNALSQPQVRAHAVEEDEDENGRPNRLLSVVDNVAIISIHGSLTNTEAWYNEYFGLIAYSEIVDALYQAALDPNIKEVLLDVASGGGAVNGVLDAVSAVEKTAKVKKVTAFTSSCMCSAAYWLVAPAHERYASAVATVGSIGVVIKHAEYSKMAEMEGVKETIIRAGEFKQLANASEPLSDKAEADLQEKADYIYSILVDSVATHLNSTYQIVDKKMAGGREFIGQQAVDVGLLDAVASFEDVFGKIQSHITMNGGQDMKKRYFGAAAMAAAAAGVDLGDAPEIDAEALAAAEAEVPTEGVPAPEAEAAGTPAEAPEVPAADAGALALLSTQLKEKDTALLEAKMELAAKDKELAGMPALKKIVAETVNNWAVALGGSADTTLSDKDVAVLESLYQTTLARTVEAFKIGGISAQGEDVDTTPAAAGPTRFDAALSKAASLNQKK